MIKKIINGLVFEGIFKGTVIAHMPFGRCKVYIPEIYPSEWLEESTEEKDVYGENLKGSLLPDAIQATPLFGGGSSASGSFSYPKIGSTVLCVFEGGNIKLPIYFASIIDSTDSKLCSFVESTALSNSGELLKHVIKCGTSKIIIDESGIITLKNDAGASIQLGPDNSININADKINIKSNTMTIETDTALQAISQGNIYINSKQRIDANSLMFNLQTNGSCLINNKDLGKI